jgi:Helix-turn-helix.
LAEVLGTSQTMYARYERGANARPWRHLLTLCEYYEVSADYMLGRTPYRQNPNVL